VRVKPQKAMRSRSHTVVDTRDAKIDLHAVQFRMLTGTGHLTTVAAIEQQSLLHQHIPGRGWDGKRWQYGKSGWFLLDFREAIIV
jgi:hypothetical protein